ncbi:MAG: hypothetical protein Q9217_002741 [Psora testacea]
MSSAQPPTGRPGKTMSSRLMTMKFMQRAAASTPFSTSPSISYSKTHAPDAESLPSKRRKVDSDEHRCAARPPSDRQQIQAAENEEAARRERAIARLAKEAGETMWVLSTLSDESEGKKDGSQHSGLRVMSAGYSDLDSEVSRPVMGGRRSFGKFNRGVERHQNIQADLSPQPRDSTIQSSEDDEVDDPTNELARGSRQEALQRAKADRRAVREAEHGGLMGLNERRKEVNLNRLSSISGTKDKGSTLEKSNRVCFLCGEKGHEKMDCLSKRRQGIMEKEAQRSLDVS